MENSRSSPTRTNNWRKNTWSQNKRIMVSQIQPKSIKEEIDDYSWIEAMKEELSQFKKKSVGNKRWVLPFQLFFFSHMHIKIHWEKKIS